MPNTGARACCPREELEVQLEGMRDPTGHCPTPDSTSSSSSASGRTRTPSRAYRAIGSGPIANSTPGPTGWAAHCWSRGLRREDVVAVVTERNLDWMAAVIAVFKAGGVYLPIEPHFPADRIATTLTRAECRLVLTEAGSRGNLDQALDSLSGHSDAVDQRTLTTTGR